MRRERVRSLKSFLGCVGLPVYASITVFPHSHLRHTPSPAPLWGEQDQETLKGLPEKELQEGSTEDPQRCWSEGLRGIHSWTPRVVTSRISLEDQGQLLSAPFKDAGCCCLRFGPISSLCFPTCLCIYFTGQCSE